MMAGAVTWLKACRRSSHDRYVKTVSTDADGLSVTLGNPGRAGSEVDAASPPDGGSSSPGHVDYQTLVERIPCITYMEVHDGSSSIGQRTTYVSPQVSRILGFSPEEFVNDPELWSKLRHPADRAKVNTAERAAELAHQAFGVEYRMHTRDGRMLWFRDEAVVTEDRETGGTFWLGVMFDITAEKQAADQANEAEVRYRTLVETLPAVVYIDDMDEQATSIYTSPRSKELLGYDERDWERVPDLWVRLLHQDDRDRAMEAQKRHVETFEPFDETYRMVARDGHVVWVHDVAFVIRDDEGTPRYSQGFILDISNQKQAEQELTDALERERVQGERLAKLDALKNALLHTLSTELRAPLTGIQAGANALLRPDLALDDGGSRDLVRQMGSRARKMERLLNDLVDLDRLGRGSLRANRLVQDVADVVRAAVEKNESLAGREVRVELESITAAVDGPQIQRIVENLVDNTVRRTPKNATISIRLSSTEGGMELAIEDDGPDVPAHVRRSMFEPFQPGGSATGTNNPLQGGIGLSLVAGLVELHGGRTWVDEREGGGSSYRVVLPNGPVGTPSSSL
jgi:PAS domain S-box-containing protein